MREKTEVDIGAVAEGTGNLEIEASGDAIIIADAIAQGLGAIADGMRLIAKALAGEEGEPMEEDRYLDGSRK